jgi:DNA (cytosine-5)-methyltransferase 1
MTTSPKLLDLFSGCGGAAEGYRRAGFDVTAVDIVDYKRFPKTMTFVVADALDYIADHGHEYQAIVGSPPCFLHSDLIHRNKNYEDHVDLIPETRAAMEASGKPYIIENVEGAPLIEPVVLCGTMFDGVRVLRHRLFESNITLTAPDHPGKHPLVYTVDKRKPHYKQVDQYTGFVSVNGGGNCSVAAARTAMGIDWMTKNELNLAIPPAYTEYLGKQLLENM